MKVGREKLLNQLEAVLPGLSAREVIEQSSCFIFNVAKKTVTTFNDEVACTFKCCISMEGAVQALPLVAILRKLREKTIEITIGDGELLIKGKNRRVGVAMEKDILLKLDSIEIPKKWKQLPEDFANAISMVQECVGKDEEQFATTCIHIHPKWIESCDNYQAARYRIKTNVTEATLVRRDSLKCVLSLDMIEFSETKTWIHFRNTAGLVLSCRRFVEDFPDITPVLKVNGTPTVLPKGLKEATEKAEIFSAENADYNQVTIQLKKDKLKITGRGTYGWFSEIKKIKYNGKPLSFTISPKLLIELIHRHNKCNLTQKRLKVDIDKFQYVVALMPVVKTTVKV